MLDSDDVEEAYYDRLVAAGTHTAEEIPWIKARRRRQEELEVCRFMMKSGTYDASCPEELVHLCYANALAGLQRRPEALLFLERACARRPEVASWALMHAKMLFVEDRKEESLARCLHVIDAFARGDASTEEAADAFHLAGWVHIHADDHSAAYALWARGHATLPEVDDPNLRRQTRKRLCWDVGDAGGECEACEACLLGEGWGEGWGEAAAEELCEGFAVTRPTHALALFDAARQQRRLVWRSRVPVLRRAECREVLARVEAWHRAERGGVWGTVRDSSVVTTDVAVEEIPALRPWLRQLLATRLCPMIEACYPRLADGSSLRDEAGRSRVRVHDAFIVRYDAAAGSLSLPEHRDTSAVSLSLALNPGAGGEGGEGGAGGEGGEGGEGGAGGEGDFAGGGIWFEALGEEGGQVIDADEGHAVFFAGPLRHAGYPITRGTRFVLVLFLYVEGFPYGKLCEEYTRHLPPVADCCADGGGGGADATGEAEGVRPSGDSPNGYVVYKQTTELVKMLNKPTPSVLD